MSQRIARGASQLGCAFGGCGCMLVILGPIVAILIVVIGAAISGTMVPPTAEPKAQHKTTTPAAPAQIGNRP